MNTLKIYNLNISSDEALNQLDSISEDIIKDSENQIQKLTNEFSSKVDKIYSTKEAEIMTV